MINKRREKMKRNKGKSSESCYLFFYFFLLPIFDLRLLLFPLFSFLHLPFLSVFSSLRTFNISTLQHFSLSFVNVNITLHSRRLFQTLSWQPWKKKWEKDKKKKKHYTRTKWYLRIILFSFPYFHYFLSISFFFPFELKSLIIIFFFPKP